MKSKLIGFVAIATILSGCTGIGQSAAPARSQRISHNAQYSQRGVRVDTATFARMTAASPRPGSVETLVPTIHIVDNGRGYSVPADAVIDRSSSGMTITVGHTVIRLSANARVVGHGIAHRWDPKT